jgi:hypothetical protein
MRHCALVRAVVSYRYRPYGALLHDGGDGRVTLSRRVPRKIRCARSPEASVSFPPCARPSTVHTAIVLTPESRSKVHVLCPRYSSLPTSSSSFFVLLLPRENADLGDLILLVVLAVGHLMNREAMRGKARGCDRRRDESCQRMRIAVDVNVDK